MTLAYKSIKIPIFPTKFQEKQLLDKHKNLLRYYNLAQSVIEDNYFGKFDSELSKFTDNKYYSNILEREVYYLDENLIGHLVATFRFKEVSNLVLNEKDRTWLLKDVVKSITYNGKVRYKSIHKAKPSIKVRADNKDGLCRIHAKELDYIEGWSDIEMKGNAKTQNSKGNDVYNTNYTKISKYKKLTNRVIRIKRLQVPNIGLMKIPNKYYNRFDLDCEKQNARITFDGKHWYISYSYIYDNFMETVPSNTENPLGVDVGIEKTLVTSDGDVFYNTNDIRLHRLEKRLKRIQRKLSKFYLQRTTNKPKNIIKLEKLVKIIYRKISNKRLNTRINLVNDLLCRLVYDARVPESIHFEKLNIRGMMRNRNMAKAFARQSLYSLKIILIQKASIMGITCKDVPMFYASSKLCSNCGSHKKDLTLKDRVYKCTSCNLEIDRDLNASINIANCKDLTVLA